MWARHPEIAGKWAHEELERLALAASQGPVQLALAEAVMNPDWYDQAHQDLQVAIDAGMEGNASLDEIWRNIVRPFQAYVDGDGWALSDSWNPHLYRGSHIKSRQVGELHELLDDCFIIVRPLHGLGNDQPGPAENTRGVQMAVRVAQMHGKNVTKIKSYVPPSVYVELQDHLWDLLTELLKKIRETKTGGFTPSESRKMTEMDRSDFDAATTDAMSEQRENSTAMVVVSGDPPGRNVCDFVRRYVHERSKLIVIAQSGKLAPGNFERMMRASMPDVEKKLRIMDAGSSLADALNAAERNRHYRPSQALEVYCDPQAARGFTQEITDGSLKFDPTVIHIVPTQIPQDDPGDIVKAVKADDEQAMHRVLDAHIFSDQDGLADYRQALLGESLLAGTTDPHNELDVAIDAKLQGDPRADDLLSSAISNIKGQVPNPEHWWKRAQHGNKFRIQLHRELDNLIQYAQPNSRMIVSPGKRNSPSNIAKNNWWAANRNQQWSDEIRKITADELHSDGVKRIQRLFAKLAPASKRIESLVNDVLGEFLTDISDDEYAAVDLIAGIVRKNRDLLSKRGIDVRGAKLLGNGANGVAWKLRSNRVLKVTTDDAEAHVASHIKGKKFKHVFTIYDVWAFPGQYNGHHVYGLVTEEGLEKPDEFQQDQFDWMVETLEKFAEGVDANLEDDLKLVLQTMMASPRIPNESKRELLKLVKQFDLVGMMADMKRLGVQADLHSGNFMKRPDGTFVIIDIGTGGSQESAKPPFIEGENIFDINVPTLDGGRLNEFGSGAPGSGFVSPPRMRGSNSSSWASGRGALKEPEDHVPEDENATEGDGALDWGPGRVSGHSF